MEGSRPHEIRIRWREGRDLFRLDEHTPRRDIKRVFDLVLETEFGHDFASVGGQGLHRLGHIEPLSQLLNRFVLLIVERPCAHLWGHVQVFWTIGCGGPGP